MKVCYPPFILGSTRVLYTLILGTVYIVSKIVLRIRGIVRSLHAGTSRKQGTANVPRNAKTTEQAEKQATARVLYTIHKSS